MANALREILASFSIDMNPVKKGLKEGEKQVDGMSTQLKKLGGVLAGAFAGKAIYSYVTDLIHSADATAKMADAMGLGIVELQEWEHAADLSGVQTEMLTMGINKLTLGLYETVSKGAGPAAESLKALGIEAKGADGKIKKSTDVISEIADAYAGMEDKAEIAPHLMKLFGEQGLKLVPMLKGGSAGIEAMRAEVEALGFAFDEDFARNAEGFDDNIDRLQKGFKGLVIQGLGPLLPDLIDLSGYLVEGAKQVIPLVKGFVRFIKETKLLQAAAGLLGLKGLSVVTKGIGGWMKSMGGLRGVIARILPLVWKFLAPMLILEDIFVFLAGGDSAIGKTLDKAFGEGTSGDIRQLISDIGELLGKFKSAPEEVRGAFANLPADLEKTHGAFGKFIGELGKNFVDTFLFATSAMTGGWENFGNKAAALGEWLLASLNIIWTELKFATLTVAAGMSDAFATAWNAIIKGAQNVLVTIAKVISKIPLMGDAAKDVLGEAAGLSALKADGDAGDVVSREWDAARMAIVADIEAATAKANATATAPKITTTNTITNTTEVSVTVPAGTPETLANRVGQAAARGSNQGTSNNLRATADALVPSPI